MVPGCDGAGAEWSQWGGIVLEWDGTRDGIELGWDGAGGRKLSEAAQPH